MKAYLPIAGAVCAGLLVASPAAAENGFGARTMANFLFQTGDANGNGRLDPDEIAALRMRAFERADADGNGTISRAEQENAVARRARRADMARMMGEEQIGRFDMNGDGAISLAEYESRRGRASPLSTSIPTAPSTVPRWTASWRSSPKHADFPKQGEPT